MRLFNWERCLLPRLTPRTHRVEGENHCSLTHTHFFKKSTQKHLTLPACLATCDLLWSAQIPQGHHPVAILWLSHKD